MEKDVGTVDTIECENSSFMKEFGNIDQVSHVGALLVRGMIRRVWRPRFLEIDNHGILRYYETTSQTNRREGTFHRNHLSTSTPRTKWSSPNIEKVTGKTPTMSNASRKLNQKISSEDLEERTIKREMQAFSLSIPLLEKIDETPVICDTLEGTLSQVVDGETVNLATDKIETNSGMILSSNFSDRPPQIITTDMTYVFDSDDDKSEEGIVVTNDLYVKGSKTSGQNLAGTMNIPKSDSWDHLNSHQQQFTATSHMELIAEKSPSIGSLDSEIRNQMSTNKVSPGTDTLHAKICNDLHRVLHSQYHHIHAHRPKATIIISSARLMDPTSLRDMHLGLPKGKFGLIFCGRTIFSEHGHDLQSFVRADVCHPRSTFHDFDISDTSREYFCAVNSRQEAQEWVSVLNRAALVASKTVMNAVKKWTESQDEDENTEAFHRHGVLEKLRNYNKKNLIGMIGPDDHSLFIGSSQSFESVETSINSTIISTSENPHHLNSISSKANLCTDINYTSEPLNNCVIIVPKIKQFHFQVIWTRFSGIKVEVIFEVHILLLRAHHMSKQPWPSPQIEHIEQRSVFRSQSEFYEFLRDIEFESAAQKEMVSMLQNRKLLFPLSFSLIESRSACISKLDTVLRDLVSSNLTCNTSKIKEFFRLSRGTNDCIHNKGYETEPTTITMVRAEGESIDDFVKVWLSSSHRQPTFTWKKELQFLILMLVQEPWIEAITSLIGFYYFVQFVFLWWKFPSALVTLRLDFLLATTFGVGYCGYVLGERTKVKKIQKRQSSHELSSSHYISNPLLSPTQVALQGPVSDNLSAKIADPTGKIAKPFTKIDNSVVSDSYALDTSLTSVSPKHMGSFWSKPDDSIFKVRGPTYLKDKVKICSGKAPFDCLGVDIWLTDNPERNISKHDYILGGQSLRDDIFVVNFLLPFANFVAYFRVPPINTLSSNLAGVWDRFVHGDQQYRDSRLKLLSVVVDGPWIVKKAVGPGTAPALLGKAIPLQYFFSPATEQNRAKYEVDIIITASRIAKGVLNVVKGHTKNLSIAFAFIIEAVNSDELPETVLCSFQVHSVHLELCPQLPNSITDSDDD